MSRRPQYSQTEIDTLVRMYQNGSPIHEISSAIGRSYHSIKQRIQHLKKSQGLISSRPENAIYRSTQSNAHGPIKVYAKKKDMDHPPSSTPVSLLELRTGICCFPIGDPRESTFHFCGKPSKTGRQYCETHLEICTK